MTEVVDAVRELRQAHTAPTIRLIGERIGIKSTGTLHNMIRDLVHDKRLVYWSDGHIAVAPPPRRAICPKCRAPLTQSQRS